MLGKFKVEEENGDLDTNVIGKTDWMGGKFVFFKKAECVILRTDLWLGARTLIAV